LVISASVALYHPEIQTYRGLSGLDSGLFSLFICQRVRRAADRNQPILVAVLLSGGLGFILKTLYEMATDLTLFVDSASANMKPLVIVHLVGAAVGCGVAWATDRARHTRQNSAMQRISANRRVSF
jgi:hypothetical protein